MPRGPHAVRRVPHAACLFPSCARVHVCAACARAGGGLAKQQSRRHGWIFKAATWLRRAEDLLQKRRFASTPSAHHASSRVATVRGGRAAGRAAGRGGQHKIWCTCCCARRGHDRTKGVVCTSPLSLSSFPPHGPCIPCPNPDLASRALGCTDLASRAKRAPCPRQACPLTPLALSPSSSPLPLRRCPTAKQMKELKVTCPQSSASTLTELKSFTSDSPVACGSNVAMTFGEQLCHLTCRCARVHTTSNLLNLITTMFCASAGPRGASAAG